MTRWNAPRRVRHLRSDRVERSPSRRGRWSCSPQDEARELGHDNIGGAHFACGSLRTGGMGSRPAVSLHWESARRRAVRSRAPARKERIAVRRGRSPFSQHAVETLKLAGRAARRDGSRPMIGTEQPPQRLIAANDRALADVLIAAGTPPADPRHGARAADRARPDASRLARCCRSASPTGTRSPQSVRSRRASSPARPTTRRRSASPAVCWRGARWARSRSSTSSTAAAGSSCWPGRSTSISATSSVSAAIRRSRAGASPRCRSSSSSCWRRTGRRCRTPSTGSPTSSSATASATSTCS